jgi:hypothetical protein
MSNNKKIIIGLAVVLVVGLYAYVYSDWFRPARVQIFHRVSAARPSWKVLRRAPVGAPTVLPPVVAFGFDRRVQLTRVKVVPLAAWEADPKTLPVWHLVSESNSVPVKGFMYGDRIRGMVPYVKDSRPQPLETNLIYRLLIEGDSGNGQHDFNLAGALPAATRK